MGGAEPDGARAREQPRRLLLTGQRAGQAVGQPESPRAGDSRGMSSLSRGSCIQGGGRAAANSCIPGMSDHQQLYLGGEQQPSEQLETGTGTGRPAGGWCSWGREQGQAAPLAGGAAQNRAQE